MFSALSANFSPIFSPLSIHLLQKMLFLQQEIQQALEQCRQSTLNLVADLDDHALRTQAHPDFSPVGWHLGHIAYTEALWLLQHCAKMPPLFPEYHRLFAADGLPKAERVNLPSLGEIQDYLAQVRWQVLTYLVEAPVVEQERFWRFIVQHESQHCETMILVLLLQGKSSPLYPDQGEGWERERELMVEIPAGKFRMGCDTMMALDNESPSYDCHLETYWIDAYPVTCGQYQKFMAAGGYENRHWWSEAGWQWLEANRVSQPLYWLGDARFADHPVCGVSWYEADAYSRFVGKELPTEEQWEKAASWHPLKQRAQSYPWGDSTPLGRCHHGHNLGSGEGLTVPVETYPNGKSVYGCYDLLGNVWEWTATWFDGYPGFQYFPYRGYSQVYFDEKHRVLKGGSWATRLWSLRSSFRNWYHPEVRQILAGFRCVKNRE